MASTPTKVDIDSCTTITLFKSIAKLVDELNDKSVKCIELQAACTSMQSVYLWKQLQKIFFFQ